MINYVIGRIKKTVAKMKLSKIIATLLSVLILLSCSPVRREYIDLDTRTSGAENVRCQAGTFTISNLGMTVARFLQDLTQAIEMPESLLY